MEQNESFKGVARMIKLLERQLEKCGNMYKQIEQSGIEAERKIEEHFHTVMNVLAARKATLLRECALNVNNFIMLEHYCDFSEVGEVTTIAGATKENEVGEESTAKFGYLNGIAWSSHDNCLYVCDSGDKAVKKVAMQGGVCSIEMSGLPHGIVSNRGKELFVTKWDSDTITKVSEAGIHVVQQFGESLFSIALDQSTGNLFVSDHGNKIQVRTPEGGVSVLAGSGECGYKDGKGIEAQFNIPVGMFFDDKSQSILVCDYKNNKIRRIALNGDVSTLCTVQGPRGVVVTSNGTILVTSDHRNVVYKVSMQERNYTAEVLAGSGKRETKGGTAEECAFNGPAGIAVDEATHSCFVAEGDGSVIRKISFL